MPKFCPFMSEDMASTKAKNSVCVESCALRLNSYCSIKILAQKAVHDSEKEKKDKSDFE